ncbi:MAG: transposase [Aigarchaeota archaeon]|nr:transposase [Candidatus Wolframiiraptor gerlachensis]
MPPAVIKLASRREVRVTVVGKVFEANRGKILALNKALDEYLRLVRWYLGFDSTSKVFLHKNCYERARELFNLNAALIQTARDKAVEILRSFKRLKRRGKVEADRPRIKSVSMRFDRRCYRFSKTGNVLTPYWLTLSLNKEERINLPIVFGEKQRQRIEEALRGEWRFTAVEMVKRDGEWYAHFVLEKAVEVVDKPETIVAVDVGERNLAVAVAISVNNPGKPMRGQFWRGAEVKRIRGLYGHVRRSLQKKRLLGKVKRLRGRERRKVEQELHKIANQIIAYARQFPRPVIVMEDLTGIRDNFDRGRRLNRRFHSLPFRRLQTYIECKALLDGINVVYLPRRLVKNTSRTCHRCGHVARNIKGGGVFRCERCGMEYDRDLNAAINIARRAICSAGWGSCGSPEPADEAEGVKLQPNAGSPNF